MKNTPKLLYMQVHSDSVRIYCKIISVIFVSVNIRYQECIFNV